MSFLGRWEIDDLLTFPANTHSVSTGAATDADSVPTYRVYEDETGTAILTGSMAKLDDAGTTGFYSEQITLSAASGFEVGKSYTVYVSATVNSVTGTMAHTFQVEAALATASALATVASYIDTEVASILAAVDTEVGDIKAKTDNLPSDPADESLILAAIAGISAGGATAADVWSYASRTLTQTAAQVAAAISGSDLSIVRAASFAATLTGMTIPATWTKIYFTVKRYPGEADSTAIVQIVASNPGVGSDGLLILNAAVASSAALASLTINQGAGTAAIVITDNATALLALDTYYYDLKALLSDGSSEVLTQARVSVAATSTESIT